MSVIPTQDNLQMTDAGLIGKSTPGVGLSGRMDAAAIRAFIGSLTQAQIETLIAGAIAALVDSSPGTLDTLNELAAALGDDPNFAATTAAAIGAKYTKPGPGIPISDLTTTVQASLGKADTALQSLPTHTHTTADITGFGEAVDDEVASLLVAGTNISLTYNDAANTLTIASTATGTIGGSTGATDNAILRADGTGGATLQNSVVTIDDSGNVSGVGSITASGDITLSAGRSLRINGSGGGQATVASGFWGDTIVGGTNGLSVSTGSAILAAASSTYAGGVDWANSSVVYTHIPTNFTATTTTLRGANAITANVGGSDVIVAGGQGRGTGVGGTIRFQTAPAGASGSALNSLVDRLTINSTGTIAFGADGVGDIGRAFGGSTNRPRDIAAQRWIMASQFALGTSLSIWLSASGSPTETLELKTSADTPISGLRFGFPVAGNPLLKRNGNGFDIRNGNDTAFTDLTLANLTANGLIRSGVFTVATLPSASANAGAFAQVTDSSVTANGSPVAGGGSNRVLVFSNGTTWDVVVA